MESTINIEKMADFFNKRVNDYDDVMKKNVEFFDEFYFKIAELITVTQHALSVLDIGCGTGLEIECLLKKALEARIFCVDIAQNMLENLQKNYSLTLKTDLQIFENAIW